MKKITKLFVSKAASVDDKNMTAKFKISDGQIDRMGEKVDQASWNFENYMLNPIVLWGHDPSQPENVLGQCIEIAYDATADATFATAKFDTDVNPKAQLIFEQVSRGTLRTTSVGFINHSEEMQDDIPVLKDNELLEWSIVPIPANPRAIALAFSEGTLSEKDMKFMLESMERETKLLHKQLNNVKKELDMTQDNKSTDDVNTKAKGDLQAICDQLGECHKACKSCHDMVTACYKALSDHCAGKSLNLDLNNDNTDDDTDTDTTDGDDTKDKSTKSTNTKDTDANDGSDDQSGADDDGEGDDGADEPDVDEETELTEEQEKEFALAFDKKFADATTVK